VRQDYSITSSDACKEDYFRTLIRLGLLSPVNPKTDADLIATGAILWLDDDERGHRAFALEPRSLLSKKVFAEVIDKSTDFRARTEWFHSDLPFVRPTGSIWRDQSRRDRARYTSKT
jgi:hypothetical protein